MKNVPEWTYGRGCHEAGTLVHVADRLRHSTETDGVPPGRAARTAAWTAAPRQSNALRVSLPYGRLRLSGQEPRRPAHAVHPRRPGVVGRARCPEKGVHRAVADGCSGGAIHEQGRDDQAPSGPPQDRHNDTATNVSSAPSAHTDSGLSFALGAHSRILLLPFSLKATSKIKGAAPIFRSTGDLDFSLETATALSTTLECRRINRHKQMKPTAETN